MFAKVIVITLGGFSMPGRSLLLRDYYHCIKSLALEKRPVKFNNENCKLLFLRRCVMF